MNKRTIKAIIGSIAKWDLIAQGISVNKGSENCPLCELFRNATFVHITNRCVGCPVYEKVAAPGCVHTPYQHILLRLSVTIPEWVNQLRLGNKEYVNATLGNIEKEVEFLISLLPESEQKAYKL